MADMHPDIGKLYRDIRNGTIGREEAVQEARRLRAAPGASLRLVRADP
jgi:hypothetical protein